MLLQKHRDRLINTLKGMINRYGQDMVVKNIRVVSYCPHYDSYYKRCVDTTCPYYPSGTIVEYDTHLIRGIIRATSVEELLKAGMTPLGDYVITTLNEYFPILEQALEHQIPIEIGGEKILIKRLAPDILKIGVKIYGNRVVS